MPIELKMLYVSFIFVEKQKEYEYMEKRMGTLRGRTTQEKQEFKFVDPRDFEIDDNEEFINRKQIEELEKKRNTNGSTRPKI